MAGFDSSAVLNNKNFSAKLLTGDALRGYLLSKLKKGLFEKFEQFVKEYLQSDDIDREILYEHFYKFLVNLHKRHRKELEIIDDNIELFFDILADEDAFGDDISPTTVFDSLLTRMLKNLTFKELKMINMLNLGNNATEILELEILKTVRDLQNNRS